MSTYFDVSTLTKAELLLISQRVFRKTVSIDKNYVDNNEHMMKFLERVAMKSENRDAFWRRLSRKLEQTPTPSQTMPSSSGSKDADILVWFRANLDKLQQLLVKLATRGSQNTLVGSLTNALNIVKHSANTSCLNESQSRLLRDIHAVFSAKRDAVEVANQNKLNEQGAAPSNDAQSRVRPVSNGPASGPQYNQYVPTAAPPRIQNDASTNQAYNRNSASTGQSYNNNVTVGRSYNEHIIHSGQPHSQNIAHNGQLHQQNTAHNGQPHQQNIAHNGQSYAQTNVHTGQSYHPNGMSEIKSQTRNILQGGQPYVGPSYDQNMGGGHVGQSFNQNTSANNQSYNQHGGHHASSNNSYTSRGGSLHAQNNIQNQNQNNIQNQNQNNIQNQNQNNIQNQNQNNIQNQNQNNIQNQNQNNNPTDASYYNQNSILNQAQAQTLNDIKIQNNMRINNRIQNQIDVRNQNQNNSRAGPPSSNSTSTSSRVTFGEKSSNEVQEVAESMWVSEYHSKVRVAVGALRDIIGTKVSQDDCALAVGTYVYSFWLLT